MICDCLARNSSARPFCSIICIFCFRARPLRISVGLRLRAESGRITASCNDFLVDTQWPLSGYSVARDFGFRNHQNTLSFCLIDGDHRDGHWAAVIVTFALIASLISFSSFGQVNSVKELGKFVLPKWASLLRGRINKPYHEGRVPLSFGKVALSLIVWQ